MMRAPALLSRALAAFPLLELAPWLSTLAPLILGTRRRTGSSHPILVVDRERLGSMFQPAFLGRAHFSSRKAGAAAQDSSNSQAAATAGEGGGGDGQSGKSEQGDAGKTVRGGVSFAFSYTKCYCGFICWCKLMQLV
jgi:hypothetical protein